VKIASWNVNSVKARLPHLLAFLEEAQPDVLCLQETKCPAADFPTLEAKGLGYHVAFGAAQDLGSGVRFGNAALSFASIQTLLIERGCSSSPVRCWPHHFDIASLTTLPAQNAGSAKYIGAGLSPGDEYYDEPYFYVSVYPKPDPRLLPTLPMLGHWHERDFVAAVATASRILKAKNQEVETDNFLSAAVGEAFKVLS